MVAGYQSAPIADYERLAPVFSAQGCGRQICLFGAGLDGLMSLTAFVVSAGMSA
jgi:hypothetical protein